MMKKRIITFGVFDFFHLGHLRLFKKIKQIYKNSYLIVGVQEDQSVVAYKKISKLFYNVDDREELLKSIKEVDEVIRYKKVDDVINHVDFEILVIGEDQGGPTHIPFQNLIQYCKKNSKKILKLKRTPEISSSLIKENECFTKYIIK